MPVYRNGTKNPTLSGLVNDSVDMGAGEQFIIFSDGGTMKIRAVAAGEIAHGVIEHAIAADASVLPEKVYIYGAVFNGVAGEDLVWADFGAALLEDDAGRLDKGAGTYWFFPIKTPLNPTGAAANGEPITYIKRGA